MQDQHGEHISHKDVLSSAMYPQVFKDWQDHRYKFGDKIARLSTRAFLMPLKEDEEITASMAPGREVTIKYKAKGELQVRAVSPCMPPMHVAVGIVECSTLLYSTRGCCFLLLGRAPCEMCVHGPAEKSMSAATALIGDVFCRRMASVRCSLRRSACRAWWRWRTAVRTPPPTTPASHVRRPTAAPWVRSAPPWAAMSLMCARQSPPVAPAVTANCVESGHGPGFTLLA